ncbi:heme biosynthesis HemY N-terminal domain-containing protein [Legionella sp. CNM-4043-24]|uniref:heme biosynthesis HemY N-terminal domain-containing protein n=1 Tax=Legionella sp. CNM-4043-24 TaxID=3421646 RepID=UPI00403AC010
MMRVLFIFLLLLVSVGLGVWFSKDPGYIVIVIHHWTIETTVLVAVAALMIGFLLLHGLLTLLRQTTKLPGNYHNWRSARRTQRAQATTRRGLIEFSEGYWASAKNHLLKALPDTDMPLLNYLTAARAAQEMGENQLRDDYLREAQQSMPDAKIAVELTQAQLQLANQQWEQALATLRHLQDMAPHHPYVLKLLMHLYQEVRDWPQLLNLLPELKKYSVISKADFDSLRQHTYLQAMTDLARQSQAEALTDMVNQLPRSLRQDTDLMICYATFLIQNNQPELAESILARCLRTRYDDKLVNLYSQINGGEKQLFFVESLLKKQADSAILYLALGRISMANRLWGKAKSYLEKSISLQASPEAYASLGKLYEQFGEEDKACQAYRQGLELCGDNAPIL